MEEGCPLRPINCWPVWASQSLTIWSEPTEAIRVPSGLKAMPVVTHLSAEEEVEAPPGPCIPDPDGTVVDRDRGDRSAVRAVREAHGCARRVPLECDRIRAGFRIPGPDG